MPDARVVIKRSFKCSPEKLWSAWTNPEEIAQWYGPENHTTVIHEMNVREGGNYRLTMRSDKGDAYPLRGTFMTLAPFTKLVMTWQWEKWGEGDSPGALTTVTVEFIQKGDETEMILTHELENEKSRELHNDGWTSSMKKLTALLEGVSK